jgi:PIN domain nuclease of toxin-antitoxin system
MLLPEQWMRLRAHRIGWPVYYQQASYAGSYPLAHRDPFDRILAAQAELEQIPLVTADPALQAFPVERLW